MITILSTICGLLLLIGVDIQAQSLAHQRNKSLGKGINLSNWLEAYWQPSWPVAGTYTIQHFQQMKEAGIHTVRMPALFANVVDTLPPYRVDTTHILFQWVDSVISWTNQLQLHLIIDNHHGWPLEETTWRHQLERFAHLWSVLAKRYRHLNPDQYFFELLNEPSPMLPLDSLNILFRAAIDSIRQHTIEHTIIVSPHLASWGMAYDTYLPLPDTNLIYTWHCYDPLNFTHQGLVWNQPFFPAGIRFPDSNNYFEQFLYYGTESVVRWKNEHNKPVFLGEFGVSRYADSASLCHWLEYIGNIIYMHEISWCYWDWQWDFPLFHSHVIAADSMYSCARRALRLYGDSSYTSEPSSHATSTEVIVHPTLLPAGSVCNVNMPSTTRFSVTIYDLAGTVRFHQSLWDSNVSLPVPVCQGIYMMLISTETRFVTKKLIVY